MSQSVSQQEPRGGDVSVNGLKLHYLDWGGDGQPIVILHATGFLGRIYRPIAEGLTAIGHVYSYDQRGHGDSEHPKGDVFEWEATVKDLEGFIIAMGLRDVRGFGHSAGGTAIGALASIRPDLISRAVLAEPVIFPPEGLQRPNDLHERTLKRRREFDSVDTMFTNFEKKPPYHTWRRDILREYCEYGTRPDGHGKRVLKCPPEVEAAYYDAARYFDGFGYILACERPLLILFGENSDTFDGVALKDRLEAGATHRRVVVVPGTSHFIPMEKPDEAARLAIEFFNAK